MCALMLGGGGCAVADQAPLFGRGKRVLQYYDNCYNKLTLYTIFDVKYSSALNVFPVTCTTAVYITVKRPTITVGRNPTLPI